MLTLNVMHLRAIHGYSIVRPVELEHFVKTWKQASFASAVLIVFFVGEGDRLESALSESVAHAQPAGLGRRVPTVED